MHAVYKVGVSLLASLDRLICLNSVYIGLVSVLAIRGPRLASSVLFQSTGMTNGVLEESEVSEPSAKRKRKERVEEESMDSDQESADGRGNVSVFSELFKAEVSLPAL